jgi:hypothetical protein
LTRRLSVHLLVVAGYAAAAIALTWPLVLHLSTHLTGPPGSDAGVYVWNQWVFQHELLENRSLPYFTDTIFSLTRKADLSLHNYTTFQNLLALPLVRPLGVLAAFNIVYLLTTVLTAYMAFLLARHVTGATLESWLAGFVFGWSPMLVTRGMAHFSVAAAAPLAAFLLVLLRTAERERSRDAVWLGVTVWWAASTDVYFAIYCLLLGGIFLLARTVMVERRTAHRRVPWALDAMGLMVAGLVVAMAISGGWQLTVFGRMLSMRSLYTPVLLLSGLALLRVAWCCRPHAHLAARLDTPHLARVFRLAALSALLAAVLLSPVLYGAGRRIVEGRFDVQHTLWRSSPRGVDLAAFVTPNPNHPLAPEAVRAWLTPQPDAYYESVASIPFVVIAVLVLAWKSGWRAPPLWRLFAIAFGLLALGPFVQIAGFNTYVPGPWALLRYVPVVGLARTPARFTIVVMLVIAVLFAAALVWMTTRHASRRRLLLAVVAAVAVFELLPAPRTLHSAQPPAIYRHVKAAPAETRVLELPFGVRDGTSSVGNFTARSQLYQTYHHKLLIGGYLSRVSRQRIRDIRKVEMLDALIDLSEGKTIGEDRAARLAADGPAFVTRARLGYVVIDRTRTPAPLRAFALRAFRLAHVETDADLELYRPAHAF